jgi:hypothetical protein
LPTDQDDLLRIEAAIRKAVVSVIEHELPVTTAVRAAAVALLQGFNHPAATSPEKGRALAVRARIRTAFSRWPFWRRRDGARTLLGSSPGARTPIRGTRTRSTAGHSVSAGFAAINSVTMHTVHLPPTPSKR